MSENLDVVRSIYAAWERGDFSSTDWADPAIEFALTGGAPGDFSARGIAAMERGWGDFLRQWADLRVHAEEIRPLDDERVLVLDTTHGHGRTSGVEIGGKSATLFHIRENRVARLVNYVNREQGLADLGLEE